jgi:NAD(P)-dependent dehydrogenase (short-subunit alcohol dehydrogenase family)
MSAAQNSSDRKVALVTGGARGIGFGIAHALARSGFHIVISDLHAEEDLAEAFNTLRAEGVDVLYSRSDVSNADDRARTIDEVRQRFGRLDVLVNNAGVAPKVRADVLEAGEDSFDRLIAINLKGPYFLTQLAARFMIELRQGGAIGRGCIVNISSCSATVASPNRGDYCISKAGISMATKLWAARLGEFGIDVYEVRPGVISTDMTAGVREKYDKLIAEGLTLDRRWGTPDDIGSAVAALARGEVPYATGQVLKIDGGMTIQVL